MPHEVISSLPTHSYSHPPCGSSSSDTALKPISISSNFHIHLPRKLAQATLREKQFSVMVSHRGFRIRQTWAQFPASTVIIHEFLATFSNLSRPRYLYVHHPWTTAISPRCLATKLAMCKVLSAQKELNQWYLSFILSCTQISPSSELRVGLVAQSMTFGIGHSGLVTGWVAFCISSL